MTDQALDRMLRRVLMDAACQEYDDLTAQQLEHDFSPGFERKMRKLIRRADHPIRYRAIRAAACLLLAVLLSGCTALAVSPEVRAAFVGWVREVSEEWFVYRYTGEEQPTLEDTVYLPAWIPEGYEEIVSPQAGTFVRTQYENGAKELLTVSYIKGTETASLNVEWEGAVVRRTSVGRLPADLYLNPDCGPNILVWTDSEKDAAFWITAPLSEGELVQVAKSIQESGPMPKRYQITWLPKDYGGGDTSLFRRLRSLEGARRYMEAGVSKTFLLHSGIPMTQPLLHTPKRKAAPSMSGTQRHGSIYLRRTVGINPSFGRQRMGQRCGCVHLYQIMR